MATDYGKIREDYESSLWQTTATVGRFLADLYSGRTHFIFELLQNAEDAGATWIEFRLWPNQLEVYHNGRPFTSDDVRGICKLVGGTKADDLTKIGKFGIGFKSVYAYTDSPCVFSGDEAFRIEDFVSPQPIQSHGRKIGGTTLFILPFDRTEVAPSHAYDQIADGLRKLSSRILLFLDHISQLRWRVGKDEQGSLARTSRSIDDSVRCVRTVGEAMGSPASYDDWLLFERPVPENKELKTQIAFSLETGADGHPTSIIPVTDTSLVVFFPTDKDTRLRFLCQGPYQTTASRDNIRADTEWNRMLIGETARLVRAAIHRIKDMGLLTVQFLSVLPLDRDDFSDGEHAMFLPIFEAVRDELLEERDLLPSADGGFVAARRAFLANGTALIGLLRPNDLASWSGVTDARWLDATITTANRTAALREYLMKELGVPEIDPPRFARQCSEAFVQGQSDDWLSRFYAFLSARPTLLRKPAYRTGRYGRRELIEDSGVLGDRAVIRLADGTHTVPFNGEGDPSAFLPGEFESDSPTVKGAILANDKAMDLFVRLRYRTLRSYDEVVEKILPKYERGGELTDDEIIADNRKIANALETAPGREREELLERVRGLSILLVCTQKKRAERCSPRSQPYLAESHTGDSALAAFLGRIGVIEDSPFVRDELVEIYGVDALVGLGCVGALRQFAEVERHILPKYAADAIGCTPDESVRDVAILVEALSDADGCFNYHHRLISEAQKCRIFWGTSARSKQEQWCLPSDIYLGSDFTSNADLETFLDGNPRAFYLDAIYKGIVATEHLVALGCASKERVLYRRRSYDGTVSIKHARGVHAQGLDGFDPDFRIEGLEHAIKALERSASQPLARVVWKLAVHYRHTLHGTVERCTRLNFSGRVDRTDHFSLAGKLLKESKWLLDARGELHKPCDLSFDRLSPALQATPGARELAAILGCVPDIDLSHLSDSERERIETARTWTDDEMAMAMEVIMKKRVKERAASSMEQVVNPAELSDALNERFDRPQKSIREEMARPSGAVPDIERRARRVTEETAHDIENEPPAGERRRTVVASKWEGKDPQTRTFLQEEYGGECQICGSSFVMRNGEPYFEASYLMPRIEARWLDRPGNTLCLCPTCRAKMDYGAVQANPSVVAQLSQLDIEAARANGGLCVHYQLCGKSVDLCFTERHLTELRAILSAISPDLETQARHGAIPTDGDMLAEASARLAERAAD